jgi:DNA-binding CsgD family transcriptional regulator/PAS domain-containing protein
MTDPRMTGFVDRIYEAAIDRSLWPGVLREYAGLVDAVGVALIVQHQESGEGDGVFLGVDPDVKPLYFSTFRQRNVLRARNDPEHLKNYRPRVVTDRDVIPRDDFLASDYYNEFLRRFDVHSVLMLGLDVQGLTISTINLTRPVNRDEFDGPELRLSSVLQPHLIRSFKLARRLADEEREHEGRAALLESSSYGVLVLAADGSVRHANPVADAMLSRRDGLEIKRGRLATSAPDTTRVLQDLVSAAASGDPDVRTGSTLTIARPATGLPLVVTITPVRSHDAAPFLGQPSVLVCISDPLAKASISERVLREAFGLTRAEARVAHLLADGRDLRQAAADLGLSFFTVRAHLARIFDKTGASRQAELVRMLTRMGAMVRA